MEHHGYQAGAEAIALIATHRAVTEVEGKTKKFPLDRVGISICAPKGIRTPDLLFRRQTLYPAELWAHILLLTRSHEPRITIQVDLSMYKSAGKATAFR